MQIVIDNRELNGDNETQINVLRILCLLEYAVAAMNLYAGELAGRQDLQPYESIMSLSWNLAYVCEAVNRFHSMVHQRLLVPQEGWDESVRESWSFLASEVVHDFKGDVLLWLRDKSVFHMDPEVVTYFISQTDRESTSVIHENSPASRHGHSPLAASILGEWLMHRGIATEQAATMSTHIYGHLRNIVTAYLLHLFPSVRATQ